MIFKLPRKRWVVLAILGTAFAVAVPVAWATFNDVSPADPFYNDVNAIQGAGITQGCGGGNFCPSASITREAEAAFTHRAAGRIAYIVLPYEPLDDTNFSEPPGWEFSITAGAVAGNGF